MIEAMMVIAGGFVAGVVAASLVWATLLRAARRHAGRVARHQRALSGQVDALLARSDGLLSELLELRAHLRRWPSTSS